MPLRLTPRWKIVVLYASPGLLLLVIWALLFNGLQFNGNTAAAIAASLLTFGIVSFETIARSRMTITAGELRVITIKGRTLFSLEESAGAVLAGDVLVLLKDGKRHDIDVGA